MNKRTPLLDKLLNRRKTIEEILEDHISQPQDIKLWYDGDKLSLHGNWPDLAKLSYEQEILYKKNITIEGRIVHFKLHNGEAKYFIYVPGSVNTDTKYLRKISCSIDYIA